MQRKSLRTHGSGIGALAGLLDVAAVLIGGVLALLWRFGTPGRQHQFYLLVLVLAAALVLALFPLLGVYRSWRARGMRAPVAAALAAWGLVFALVLIALVGLKENELLSRWWLAQWFVLTALLLLLIRVTVFTALRLLRARGYNLRRAVIVGCGAQAHALLQRARDPLWAGFDVLALFDPGEGDPCCADGVPVLPLAQLATHVEANAVDEVWISLPLAQSALLQEILLALRTSTANVRYLPDLLGLFLLNQGVSEILDTPMLDLSASPLQGASRAIKRIEDVLLAGLILLLISPLLLLIAIGVKLSSRGPVFYKQERLTWSGKSFCMFKFRSMPVDAEGTEGPQWARKNDNRATAFGSFLRRTSLDELPQFINVLRGEMSIVGPRPERPVFVEQFKDQIPGYMQKHMVKAGITGWAQVNGWRGNTDLAERIQHDLYYIEHWSLLFDLRIIALTLVRGFVHKNAY